MGNHSGEAAHTEYWLQKWIAIAESIGVSKKALLEEYYFDEFLTVLDAYNEMHTPGEKNKAEEQPVEVGAEDW